MISLQQSYEKPNQSVESSEITTLYILMMESLSIAFTVKEKISDEISHTMLYYSQQITKHSFTMMKERY